MNEFAINWLKGGEYAEITAPASTALKNKLLSGLQRSGKE